MTQCAPIEEAHERLTHQERLIIDVAEKLLFRSVAREKTPKEIGKALRKAPAQVNHLLNGEANMTLRTLSDLAFALDCMVEVQLRPLDARRQSKKKEDK